MITSLAPQDADATADHEGVHCGHHRYLAIAHRAEGQEIAAVELHDPLGAVLHLLISTPAQKPLPAPRSSRQRTSGLEPMLAMTAASSFQALLSSALTGGRSETTSPMCA